MPTTWPRAVALVSADPEAEYLAGGTTELDLVLKDGVLEPGRLVDITRLPLRGISRAEDTLRVGALVTMNELAADPTVSERRAVRPRGAAGGCLAAAAQHGDDRREPPAAHALSVLPRPDGAGLQQARSGVRVCGGARSGTDARDPGRRASTASPCTPRTCACRWSRSTAVVDIQGVDGSRSVPLTEFYVLPGERPDIENVLQHGELITRIRIPLLPVGTRSGYLKVRDRASYEFALTSAAAALLIEDGTIVRARLALGGVGTVPWRALEAEEILHGAPATGRTFRAAARGRASLIRSRSRAPRSRSSSPSARSSGSCKTVRESSHDDRHTREDHR